MSFRGASGDNNQVVLKTVKCPNCNTPVSIKIETPNESDKSNGKSPIGQKFCITLVLFVSIALVSSAFVVVMVVFLMSGQQNLGVLSNSPEGVVKAYLSAFPEDRFKYICKSSELSKDEFLEYYSLHGLPEKLGNVVIQELTEISSKAVVVKAKFTAGEDEVHGVQEFVVMKIGDDWLIDWVSDQRVFGNVNDMWEGRVKSLKAFLRVCIDDYYNHEFRKNRFSYYSLEVFPGNGYLKKSDPGAEPIYQAIKNGKPAIIKCVIQYPRTKGDTEIFEIHDAKLIEYD